MLTEREFTEKKVGLRALLANLTIQFRKHRQGEARFSPCDSKGHEDALIEAGFVLAEVLHEYDARLEESCIVLERAAEILTLHAPAVKIPPHDLADFGDCLETARRAAPRPIDRRPVYQPEENLPKTFLSGMVRPAAPSIADGVVVPFERPANDRSGGAA